MSRLIISQMPIGQVMCNYTALIEENRLIEFHFRPLENRSILGNIYVGQVDKIVPNIQAAFVKINKDTPCYYPLKETEEAMFATVKKNRSLAAGDQILVQVGREAMKGKPPLVTSNLSFTGRYLVLTTGKKNLGISRKLSKEASARLRGWLEPYCCEKYGIVARTNSGGASKEEILEEMEYLRQRCFRVLEYGTSRTCFSLLEETPPFYLQVIRDTYTRGLEEIVTDIPMLREQMEGYFAENHSSVGVPVRFYEDKQLSLGNLYSIPKRFKEACQEKVWMNSGGFLVIQQTDAFVSVDVNTGKYTGKRKAEETYRKINLEAAGEIARQLRLRNLSGIILIDFINMDNPDHVEELLHVLQKHLRKDPVKARVHDMTELNIVEVTRKKVEKPLWEEISLLEV